MKSKSLSLYLMLFLINGIILRAQNITPQKSIKGPEAASIERNIQVPVSMYTGKASISIPLYEISIKGASVPISLNYDGCGGIKVDEEATMVGLGWRLSYGGSVSRSLKGKPDEALFFEKQTIADYFKLPAYEQDQSEAERTKYISKAKDPNDYTLDVMPDEFFYNFGTYSGKFMYKQSLSRFVLYPKDDIAIKYNKVSGPAYPKIDTWELVAPDGTKYAFGGDGISRSALFTTGTSMPVNLPIDNMWSIKKITTTNGESINYTYGANSYYFYSRSTNEYYDFQTQTIVNLPPASRYDYDEPLINAIAFPNGNISFVFASRLDFPSKRVEEMIVKDLSGKIIRRIKFYYNYFNGDFGSVPAIYRLNSTADLDNKRLRLDSLAICSTDNSVIQKYKFDYYTGDGRLPSKYSFAQDCWGYFNGATNSTWVPKLVTNMTKGGDRKVNNLVNNVFALKSVTYPTGGRTELVYEGNVAKATGFSAFSNMLYANNYVSASASLTIGTSSPNASVNGENYYYKTFTIPSNGGYSSENGWSSLFGASISGAPADAGCTFNYATFALEKQLVSGTYQTVQNYKYCNGINAPVDTKTLTRLDPGNYRLVISTKFASTYTQNGSLSGLKVSFTWLNYITGANESINVGGLRVKEIKYYSSANTLSNVKNYVYTDDNGVVSGSVYSMPSYLQYVTGKVNNTNRQTFLRAYGSPIEPFQTIAGSYLGYSNVRENTVNTNNPSDVMTTKYTYSYITPIYEAYGSPTVYLDGLAERHEWQFGKLMNVDILKAGKPIKTESYTYNGFQSSASEDYVETIMTNHISWLSLNNILLTETSSIIDDFTDDYFLQINPAGVFGTLGGFNSAHFIYGVKFYGNASSQSLVLPYLKHYTGFDKVATKTTTTYDGDASNIQTESFSYEKIPNHFQLTKSETTNSKNQQVQQLFYYPFDFSSESACLKMHTLNMRNKIIKQDNYVNGSLTTSDKTNYFDWSNNILAPKSIERKTRSYSSETLLQYNSYDNTGNLLNANKTGNYTTTYVYSYNRQYVIAEINNADYATVISVLGGASAVNNFSQSNPTDQQVNDFLSPLRSSSQLTGAKVHTYIYAPLIGITSDTDPSGLSTYYEYDSIGRLKLVRDNNRNIIKEFDYKYNNQ